MVCQGTPENYKRMYVVVLVEARVAGMGQTRKSTPADWLVVLNAWQPPQI